jgi:methylmalonyl-CoA/ethylmalonyl-CoA epimerase
MTSAAGRSFRILGINHLGLAPKDAAKARSFFTNALGLGFLGKELVKDQMTNTVMIDSAHAESGSASGSASAHIPTGRPMLEILENETGPDGPKPGPIAAFLAKKGSGIHHVALQVDHVDNAIAWLKQNGVRLIDETPRKGSHNTKIAFIHPESTGGLLVELVQQL